LGTKDIPQKSTLIALALAATLMGGSGYINSREINNLQEQITNQHEVVKSQQAKLGEQGSLINQQKKGIEQLSGQAQKDLTAMKEQYDSLLQEKEQRIQSLQKENELYSIIPSRGEALDYKEFYVEASGYTAYCNGCSGKTAWKELDLRKHPEYKVVAVDPNVIPLGSKVYIEGYGYAIAGDTGGAIKGYKVDLFYPEVNQALQWGRKSVKIKVFN
jgi:3D (Asp-Asp-Asp) domain-containing protein